MIAHDRRGHGRSTQTSDGHEMDHYADDLAAVFGWDSEIDRFGFQKAHWLAQKPTGDCSGSFS